MAGACSLSLNMIRWDSWNSHFVPGHRPIWGGGASAMVEIAV